MTAGPARPRPGVLAAMAAVAAVVLAADAISKALVLSRLAGHPPVRLFRAPGPLRGRVVDWINLPHFPWTFNLADASISCAAVLIAFLALRGIRIEGASAAPAPAADPS